MLTCITNNCYNWRSWDVFTLSCAPVTICVGHPHTFLPSLPWETASPQLQFYNPGGAACHRTWPLAHRNSHDVTQPDLLFHFGRCVTYTGPIVVLL